MRYIIFSVLLSFLTSCSKSQLQSRTPAAYLGGWSVYSRNYESLCGDMSIGYSTIDFSVMGSVPYEIVKISTNEIYLQLHPKRNDGYVVKLGPISKSRWNSDEETMAVTFYATKEDALKDLTQEFKDCFAWGVYWRKAKG